jgi:hypothetical protein
MGPIALLQSSAYFHVKHEKVGWIASKLGLLIKTVFYEMLLYRDKKFRIGESNPGRLGESEES